MIAGGQTTHFFRCRALMLSHVLVLHLYHSLASSEPVLTSPGWMERRIRRFHYLALGRGHIQPEKQPCHMPFARLGRAAITRRWPCMGHQPHCLQEAPVQSMELERPQGSEGLFTGDERTQKNHRTNQWGLSNGSCYFSLPAAGIRTGHAAMGEFGRNSAGWMVALLLDQ